jgi:hypothetical protein
VIPFKAATLEKLALSNQVLFLLRCSELPDEHSLVQRQTFTTNWRIITATVTSVVASTAAAGAASHNEADAKTITFAAASIRIILQLAIKCTLRFVLAFRNIAVEPRWKLFLQCYNTQRDLEDNKDQSSGAWLTVYAFLHDSRDIELRPQRRWTGRVTCTPMPYQSNRYI